MYTLHKGAAYTTRGGKLQQGEAQLQQWSNRTVRPDSP